MKIAILGGSFDPPHKGHIKIAEQVLLKLHFDQVWLMPCFTHAFGKKLSSPQDRLNMTKLLQAKNIKISNYETEKKEVSISFETLESLSKLYPQDYFFWIIGSDQIDDFPKWNNWQEIINKYGLIIIKRNKKEDIEEKTKNIIKNLDKILFLESANIPNISSTEIREKVKNGKPISNLVPEKVEEYINRHNLYK